MVKLYSTRPSTMLGVEDEYTAYCIDEACSYISNRIEQGYTPSFETRYSSFSDMYRELQQEGVN